ncbi:MAG: hypothetical protein ABI744_08275 [Chloroflexota bacterium]
MMRSRSFALLLVALLVAACVDVTPLASDPPSASSTPPSLASPSLPSTATPIAPASAGVSPSAPVATPTVPVPVTPTVPPVPTPSGSPAIPKAVFIVGPTDELTEENLTLAETMAEGTEAAGMQVTRVFYPHATWDNVLAAIQGASLVAYFGHGYGWPSNTPELWEVQQDGMGLNAYDGSGVGEVHYYGANKLRESIRLAPHAVVFLMRGCYTAGNGLNTAPIPPLDVARQHVDNFASGWLAVGAGAVLAFAFGTHSDYASRLMLDDATTIDEMFSTAGDALNLNPLYFDSIRTAGARNHLDPDPNKGYLRAVSGDLALTASVWASGAGQTVIVSSSLTDT